MALLSTQPLTEMGTLNSGKPLGHSRPVKGLIYLFYTLRRLYKKRKTIQAMPVSYQCVYRFSIVALFLEYGKPRCVYRGADKSVARPGREQANVSVRMA